MPEDLRRRLLDLTQVFVHEKRWEGVGIDITGEMKAIIAANACLLLLGIEHDYFANVPSIILYPKGYSTQWSDSADLIVEEGVEMLGEAHYRGPVTLSWEDIRRRRAGRREGVNLVIHEFAHKLDMADDWINGTPPMAGAAEKRWAEVMSREFAALREADEHGRRTLLDPYGTTDEAEFFAVCTESFFQKPRQLKQQYPELYEVLSRYFNLDPAGWGSA